MNIELLLSLVVCFFTIVTSVIVIQKEKKAALVPIYIGAAIMFIILFISYASHGFQNNSDSINTRGNEPQSTFVPFSQGSIVTQESVTQPQKKDLTYISFTGHNFSRGKRFKVYSAPSTTSWFTKASNGDPVHASTNDIIYVAGYAGNWLLIRYETKGGSYRTGYTSEASGSFNTLSFNYYTGTITSNCSLTDGTSSIDISSDTTVTVLGRMDAGIYIEAHVNGQQARGIVPESCVSW